MKEIKLFILLALGLTGCEGKGETYYLRSYVMNYYGYNDIFLSAYPETQSIIISARDIYSMGGFESDGLLKESYDALCEKNRDMSYNRKITVKNSSGNWTKAYGIDFIRIDITSQSDYNSSHPAGTSLCDIVEFSAFSLKPYIESEYQNCERYSYGVGCVKEFRIPLTEFNYSPVTLIGKYGSNNMVAGLQFLSYPDSSSSHTFTVTMTTDDGRVFEASIEVQFE